MDSNLFPKGHSKKVRDWKSMTSFLFLFLLGLDENFRSLFLKAKLDFKKDSGPQFDLNTKNFLNSSLVFLTLDLNENFFPTVLHSN